MRRTEITALCIVILLAASMEAGAVQTIQIDNEPSGLVEIVPLDDAHISLAPTSLRAVYAKLPPGSFILKNNTETPITVIVTVWNYTDAEGKLQRRGWNFDAYLLPPLDPLVKPHQTALVTPFGCMAEDLFPRLTTGQGIIGSPLGTGERPISAAPGVPIHLYIDSVFFADGRIWGPDKSDYSAKLRERYKEIQDFTSEVSAGLSGGEDLPSLLSKIQAEAKGKRGKASAHRAVYASMLLGSPHPEKALQQLQGQTPLPQFRHIGGNPQ